MAKRSDLQSDSFLIDEPVFVRLASLRAGKIFATGPITGKQYVFDGAGSQQDVDELDAVEFLKRTHQSCCTGNVGHYFEVVR